MFSPLKVFAMILFNQISAAALLSYALLAVRRRGYAHRVAKACSGQGRSQTWASLLGHPGSEIGGFDCNSGRARDSSVGHFLPDALLPLMGVGLLLLRG